MKKEIGKKKILVVSPTCTHPQNAGNRARIYTMLKNLKEMGYEIHFLYCGEEFGNKHVKKSPNFVDMIKDWDRVFFVSYFSFELPFVLQKYVNFISRKLQILKKPFYPIIGNLWRIPHTFTVIKFFFIRNISRTGKWMKIYTPTFYKWLKPFFPDKRGKTQNKEQQKNIEQKVNEEKIKSYTIDAWYNFNLDKLARKLHKQYEYNVVLCEYVYISRVLNNFGNDVLKIIDTHDIFTDRNKKYDEKGIKETFFSTTKDEEIKGLNRADKIIAIQEKEAKFFREITNKEVITIGHPVKLNEPNIKHEVNKNILYIGTGNAANIHGINWFINEVIPLIKNKIPEVKLITAGNICKHIGNHEDVVKMGEVKDINDAYNQADIVINPGAIGTGLKIKNIEALGLGKILITSSHSAEGLKKDSQIPFLIADRPEEFANAIINVMSNIGLCNNMSLKTYDFVKEYNQKNISLLRSVFDSTNDKKTIFIPKSGVIKKLKTDIKFIIFTFPRTGSSTLRKLLDLHPDISCIHEPFNKNLKHVRNLTNNKYQAEDVNNAERLHFVLGNIFKNYEGIKHLACQLKPELNEELIKYSNCKIVFLWRKNILQRLISNNISNQAQYWQTDTGQILKKKFDSISIDKLRKNINNDLSDINKYRNLVEANTDQYFELTYEDLYDLNLNEMGKLMKLNQLFDFLGVQKIRDENLIQKAKDLLNPQKTKLNSELTYKLIPNIHEIEEVMGCKETGYIFQKN